MTRTSLERRPDEAAEGRKEPQVRQGAASKQGRGPCEKTQRRRATRICRGPTGLHPVGALAPLVAAALACSAPRAPAAPVTVAPAPVAVGHAPPTDASPVVATSPLTVAAPSAAPSPCSAVERCAPQGCLRLTCGGHWPSSLVALAPGRAVVALFDRSGARATAALTLAEGAVERAEALPEGLGIPHLAARGAGAFDVLGDAPAQQRVMYHAPERPVREPLPEVGRIVLGAARRSDGRLAVLLARGGPLPIPFHLASRSTDGVWSSREVGASPWPYAALTADGAGRPIAAYCVVGARPSAFDLVVSDDAGARRAALRGVPCGDRSLVAAASDDTSAIGFRAGDIHLAVAGRDGRYVDLRVPGTDAPRTDACPLTSPLGPGPGEGRCTARGVGASAFALAGTSRDVWLAYLAVTNDTDYRVERHCHPVDPVGRRPPPPSCEDNRILVEDRSEASLVVARVDATAARPAVAERVRVPLGRLPPMRNLLLVAAAGDTLHALVATAIEGASVMRYVTVDLTSP